MLARLFEAVVVFLVARRLYFFIRGSRDYSSNIPRIYTPIQPRSLWAAVLPKSPFHRRLGDHWDERKRLYKDAPFDTVVIQPWLAGPGVMYSRNIAAFTQSLALGSNFIKETDTPLNMLGENLASTEGDAWRRHRRIAAPAFNHTTYRNVWDTTARVFEEMKVTEGWNGMPEANVANVGTITHKLTLLMIANVGFGLTMHWNEPRRDNHGKLSAQAMVFDIAAFIMDRWILPSWLYHLGIPRLKRIEEAYSSFPPFVKEKLGEREDELRKLRATDGSTEEERAELIKDVFGRLVNARLSDKRLLLSDREIVGNSFIFIFAGHETTASSLTVVLAMLALYPEEQEWVYQSIVDTISEREPTFEDFDSLVCVLSCLYEGLRLYPQAYFLSRIAAKDTVIMIPKRNDPSVSVPISLAKGSSLMLDMIGMCYDPVNFPDPEAFKPRRWSSSRGAKATPTGKATEADEVTGNSPASTFEGFLGFSYGPRTCIGHKFAKVEAVAFLTLLLREWKVSVDLKGESREAWRMRVLAPTFAQAMLLGDVPLKFGRRK